MWNRDHKYSQGYGPDCDDASRMAKQFVDARSSVTFNVEKEKRSVLKKKPFKNDDHFFSSLSTICIISQLQFYVAT